jgi:spiro-SPASM protein
MAIEKVFHMSIITVDMKNLAVINAVASTPLAERALPDGSTALQRVAAYARGLPGVERAFLLLPESTLAPRGAASRARRGPQASVPQGLEPQRLALPGGRGPEGFTALLRRLRELSQGYESVFYLFADCPLLDPSLSAAMLESHRRYFADYTFADGYPYGLAPEILRAGVLPALIALAERSGGGEPAAGAPPIAVESRQGLFDLIKRDINAFDIETELSPVDLRQLRVELCTDTRRNTLLVERLMNAGAADAASVCRLLQEQAELLRTLPAFVAVQIVEGCPQVCSYCPYGQRRLEAPGKLGEMPPDRFGRVLDQVTSLCDDAVIGVSLWGEPAYHSRFPELAAMARQGNLKLVVETSGVAWPDGSLEETARRAPEVDWIVSLDAQDPALYSALRGEGREEALNTVQRLHELYPGRVYPQAVRMKENEEDLEGFYRHFRQSVGNVIIQKYDFFCGVLPDRRVTDLAPLRRLPCWHLKRDVSVLIDGRVPLCREDLEAQHLLGNLFEEPLADIWARGATFHRRHVQTEYPRLCAGCDEYYTFNF